MVGSIIQQLPASAEPPARRASRAAAGGEPALQSIAEGTAPAEEPAPATQHIPALLPPKGAAAGKPPQKALQKSGKKAASGSGQRKGAAAQEAQPAEEVQPKPRAPKRPRNTAAAEVSGGQPPEGPAPAAPKRAKRDRASASVSPEQAADKSASPEGAPPL